MNFGFMQIFKLHFETFFPVFEEKSNKLSAEYKIPNKIMKI